ncbi:MAG: aromatic ring-hydroxylating oxygenase subunit alpha [Woeseiaceae bacterium]
MIDALIADHKSGYALARDFYMRKDVYQQDVANIFLNHWILVGHQSEIGQPGDFFVTQVAGESVIVARNDDGEINALLNVCRHRGSRVCLEESGRKGRFVCPYHAWTYNLKGELLAAPRTEDGFDRDSHSLRSVKLEVFHGMLFINFDTDADFTPAREQLNAPFEPYGLADAKIAHRHTYRIEANWKLAVENFCECYHCVPAHSEYSVAHSGARPDKVDPEMLADVMARVETCGLWPGRHDNSFMAADPAAIDSYFIHFPLLKGHVTGSQDGQPVAPLLGSVKDYDGGAADFQIGPVSYGLAYNDHVVLYRFIPVSMATTDCEVIWLVRGDAEEGEDYDLEKLIWLWDVTTVADKKIIQDNARGVESHFYTPGPFVPMERYAQQFTEWYLDVLKG